MELKDLFYLLGLLLTFGLSLVSLILNIKNQKNALREHLYKEQIAFFYKITAEFSAIGDIFEDILVEQVFTKNQIEIIQSNINRLQSIVDTHDFIIPDELFSKIYKNIEASMDFKSLIISTKGKIVKKQLNDYLDFHYDLVEDIREFAGVDELSEVNKKLYQSKKSKE